MVKHATTHSDRPSSCTYRRVFVYLIVLDQRGTKIEDNVDDEYQHLFAAQAGGSEQLASRGEITGIAPRRRTINKSKKAQMKACWSSPENDAWKSNDNSYGVMKMEVTKHAV